MPKGGHISFLPRLGDWQGGMSESEADFPHRFGPELSEVVSEVVTEWCKLMLSERGLSEAVRPVVEGHSVEAAVRRLRIISVRGLLEMLTKVVARRGCRRRLQDCDASKILNTEGTQEGGHT